MGKRKEHSRVFLVGRTEKGQGSSWKADDKGKGKRQHTGRIRKKNRKAHAARLRTKVAKSWPETGLCPAGPPLLMVAQGWCLPLAKQAPLHRLPDLYLLSLTASLSARSGYVFGIQAGTLSCEQVPYCFIPHTYCTDKRKAPSLPTLLQKISSALQVTEVKIILGKGRTFCLSEAPQPFSLLDKTPEKGSSPPGDTSAIWPAAKERRCSWKQLKQDWDVREHEKEQVESNFTWSLTFTSSSRVRFLSRLHSTISIVTGNFLGISVHLRISTGLQPFRNW